MENANQTGITIRMTTAWKNELPKYTEYHSDYPDETLDGILNGFLSCMIGHTWDPQMVLEGMRDFANEHLDLDESTEN